MEDRPRPTIERTIELIKVLHAGVFDEAGLPYWMHPVAVMEMLPEDELRALGYSERTIQLVCGVSSNRAPEGLTYKERIRLIAASGMPGSSA